MAHIEEEESTRFISFSSADNAAVAVVDVSEGDSSTWGVIRQAIPAGHKVATCSIRKGEPVRLYAGESIGIAARDIAPGEWIHTHNLKSELDLDSPYPDWIEPRFSWESLTPTDRATFAGFVRMRRSDRRVGTRNDVWVIPTSGCAVRTARAVGEFGSTLLEDPECNTGSVDKVHVLEHPFGCSECKSDLEGRTRRVLWSHLAHPNAGAVVLVRLGCEDNRDFIDLLRTNPAYADDLETGRIGVITMQEMDQTTGRTDLESGRMRVRDAIEYAKGFRREMCPVSDLTLGVKCGASGPFSGITANPLLGRVADRFVRLGATVLITEFPEFFGAVHTVLRRCVSRAVYDKTASAFARYRDELRSAGEAVDTNPSKGNVVAGLTTLAQKSLGAVLKGGCGPVVDCLDYGEPAAAGQGGLVLCYGPGNDPTAITTLETAGASLIAWTTQLGTPVGAHVPTPKVFAHSVAARRFAGWCDFDAGGLVSPKTSWTSMTDALYGTLLDIAEGKKAAKNEINDEHALAIWSKIAK